MSTAQIHYVQNMFQDPSEANINHLLKVHELKYSVVKQK